MTSYSACPSCKRRTVWALTASGRRQMLDWQRDPEGDIAAYQDAAGTWHARTLAQAEQPAPHEHRYSHHWAASPQCRPPSQQQRDAAEGVVAYLDAYRAAKSGQAKARRQRRGRKGEQPITGFRKNP